MAHDLFIGCVKLLITATVILMAIDYNYCFKFKVSN